MLYHDLNHFSKQIVAIKICSNDIHHYFQMDFRLRLVRDKLLAMKF